MRQNMKISHGTGRRKLIYGCMIIVCTAFFLMFFSIRKRVTATTNESSDLHDIFHTEEFEIHVSYGVHGAIKVGRDATFSLYMKTYDKKFDGMVYLITSDVSGKAVSVGKEIHVGENASRTIYYKMRINNLFDQYRIKVKSNTNNEWSQMYPIQIDSDPDKIYTGVLSRKDNNLHYLEDKFYVIPVSKEDLDCKEQSISIFDVIVIDDYDVETLSETALKKLMNWVSKGGTLTIGTGKYFQDTLGQFRKNKMFKVREPYHLVNSKFIVRNMEEEVIYSNEEQMNYQNMRRVSYDTVDLQVMRFHTVNAFASEVQDKVPLLDTVAYEDGVIQLFHVWLGDPSVTNHKIHLQFLNLMKQYMSKVGMERLETEQYLGEALNMCVEGLPDTSVKKIPKRLIIYGVLLIFYIVILIPLIFLLLHNKKKDIRIWMIVVVSAVVYSGVAYFMGKPIRLSSIHSTYVTVDYLNHGTVIEKTLFAVKSPDQECHQITADNQTTITPINGANYWSAKKQNKFNEFEEKRTVEYYDHSTCLRMTNEPTFTVSYYTANTTFSEDRSLCSDFKVSQEGIKGECTNQLGYDLKDCYLISGGTMIYLGNMKDGDKISANNCKADPILTSNYIYQYNLIDQTLTGKQVNEKKNALISVLENYFQGDYTDSILIGFTDHIYQNSFSKRLESESKTNGYQMIVTPVEVSGETKDGNTFVPCMEFPYTVLEGTTYSNYRFMNGTLTLSYTILEEEDILGIYYSVMNNCEYQEERMEGFTGTIYFYNIHTNKYDPMFQTSGEVKHLESYISKDHKLIVKYLGRSEESDYMTIPYLSYVRRKS